jgi:hypothetical protein
MVQIPHQMDGGRLLVKAMAPFAAACAGAPGAKANEAATVAVTTADKDRLTSSDYRSRSRSSYLETRFADPRPRARSAG